MDTGRLHILVVDDVADMADSTAELLRLWGYDAVACYDGATALQSARARQPDAVILDLAMPQMDGFRCARVFRGLVGCEEVPIIAVTGYSGAEHYARAREVGIHYYLLKSSEPDRLRELLAWEVMPAAVPDPLPVSSPLLPRSATRDPVFA